VFRYAYKFDVNHFHALNAEERVKAFANGSLQMRPYAIVMIPGMPKGLVAENLSQEVIISLASRGCIKALKRVFADRKPFVEILDFRNAPFNPLSFLQKNTDLTLDLAKTILHNLDVGPLGISEAVRALCQGAKYTLLEALKTIPGRLLPSSAKDSGGRPRRYSPLRSLTIEAMTELIGHVINEKEMDRKAAAILFSGSTTVEQFTFIKENYRTNALLPYPPPPPLSPHHSFSSSHSPSPSSV